MVIVQILIKCGAHAQNSVSFFIYFCCFWINVTQINFENITKIQRIISDSCFQLKLWFNVDARAPSIPLLNFPFKPNHIQMFTCIGGVQFTLNTSNCQKKFQFLKLPLMSSEYSSQAHPSTIITTKECEFFHGKQNYCMSWPHPHNRLTPSWCVQKTNTGLLHTMHTIDSKKKNWF